MLKTAPGWTRRSEREVAAIVRYRDDLLAGRIYGRHAASVTSVIGYRPPATRDEYGRIVETLGVFARQSDRDAATAYRILPKLPLYGDPGQLAAGFWNVLSEVHRAGFEDVIGRTGPNAGRPSAHQHATSEAEAIRLALLGTELTSAMIGLERADLGWCLAALAGEPQFYSCRWGLNRVRKALETER